MSLDHPPPSFAAAQRDRFFSARRGRGRARGASGDFLSRAGAERLKERIRAFWGEGAHITFFTEGGTDARNTSVCSLRSDMVNGMPRKFT